MNIYEVIVRPIVTEKSVYQREIGQYVFEVNSKANKKQIKQAVEQIYDVNVDSVNVMVMPAKMSRMGRRQVTRKSPWKKAIVTLAPGERIGALEA